MDPIQDITITKDSSFAMLLAAQKLGWETSYMEADDLFLSESKPCARMRSLRVDDNIENWYRFTGERTAGLDTLDCILMRIDPPVDLEYIYITQMLQIAQHDGVIVVNDPAALRDLNEKLYINSFPDLIAPTLVTRSFTQVAEFLQAHKDIILKPLDGMGGRSIFRIKSGDTNLGVILETLTARGGRYVMAQRFIPEIEAGDKRILLIEGEPVDYALARIPTAGDHRGNIAAGGRTRGQPLTARDREICARIGPKLREKGLLFVGIDVIGEFLTEINITSPTCIRELDAIYDLDIASRLLAAIAGKVA